MALRMAPRGPCALTSRAATMRPVTRPRGRWIFPTQRHAPERLSGSICRPGSRRRLRRLAARTRADGPVAAAPDRYRPLRSRLDDAGAARRAALLAAVSALERRRDQAALDRPAARHLHRRGPA